MELFKKRKGLRNPSIKTLQAERRSSIKNRDVLHTKYEKKLRANNNIRLPETINNVIADKTSKAYGKRIERLDRIISKKKVRENAKKLATLNNEGKKKFGRDW